MIRVKAVQRTVVVSASMAALAGAAVICPPAGMAAVCGPETFYAAPSDACLVAAAEPAPAPPPPAPPPPPAWNAPTPWVSASICAPIPFANLYVGV